MYSEPEYQNSSTLRLQHAINEFKQKQYDRFKMENKLHVIKQKCQTNRRKAKVIKNQVSKINNIKQEYQLQKHKIQHLLADDKEKHARKIQEKKTFRERSKENMNIIRNLIHRQKVSEHNEVRERSKINQMRITQNLRQTLHLKREKSLQIKIKEENSRLNREVFLEKKRLMTQSQSEADLRPIKANTDLTNQYIQQMKLLEHEMVQKLNTSRTNLNCSRTSLKRTLR